MGQALDRYELLDVLGTGAFATVWRAHDPVIDQQVAIKVLADNWSRDMEVRQRFLKEAKVAMQVTNEHLIRVHTVAESADTNTPYIVMALADAGTLRERINARRLNPYDTAEALQIVRDIAVAIAALHDNGLLHRDLKPANILFQQTRTGGERVVLGDFGLARAIDRSALTMVSGTPAFAAPEQAAGMGQLTEQADLYPLGIMLIELLTGALPTTGASMADTATSAIDIDRALATPNQVAVDPHTRALLSTLLAASPNDRPPSAHEVVSAIDGILTNQQTLIQAPQPATPPPVASAPATPATPVPQGQANLVPPVVPPQVSSEPTYVGDTSSNSNNGRMIGLLAAALVGLALIGGAAVAVFSGGDDSGESATPSVEDELASSTTETQAPDTTTTTTTTSTTTTTTTPLPSTTTPEAGAPPKQIPGDFPVPASAILDIGQSNGSVLRTYNIAGTPQDVLARFQDVSDWAVDNVVEEGDMVQFDVFNETDTLLVTVTTRPNTAGTDISVLRIEVPDGL